MKQFAICETKEDYKLEKKVTNLRPGLTPNSITFFRLHPTVLFLIIAKKNGNG